MGFFPIVAFNPRANLLPHIIFSLCKDYLKNVPFLETVKLLNCQYLLPNLSVSLLVDNRQLGHLDFLYSRHIVKDKLQKLQDSAVI